MKREVKTRFIATHTMIRSFMKDPNENKPDKAIDEVKVMENIQAVNAAPKSSVKSSKSNRKISLSS